jgi:hypothetical protein
MVFEWTGLALFVWFAFTGLLLWRPGYFAWSLLTGGVLLLWTLLMFDDIARCVNRVRGNAVYWLIFGCCVILGGHLLADQYIPQVEASKLSGGINISMFFHLTLIAVAVLLAQRIGDIPSLGSIFPDSLAVLMTLGGGITAAAVPNGPGRDTLWLIAASGICIGLIPLVRAFSINATINTYFSDLPPPVKVKLLLRLFVASCAAILLLVIANLFCLSVIAGCAIIVGILYISARLGKPIACWAVAGLGAAAVIVSLYHTANFSFAEGILGMGEKGFSMVFGGSSGLSILFATTGWAGVVLVIFGGGAIAASGMLRTKRAAPESLAISAVWILATFIASAAFFARGGYVSPASVIALAVTWGLWPKMVGEKACKERSGWILLAVVFSLLGLVAIVKDPGLLGAMGTTCGLKDKGQHFIAGFLVTMVVVWVMGRRWWWLGAIGLGLAAMSGGVAEIVQKEFSKGRGAEMADWKAHLWGSAVAGLIFVVGVCYRHAMRMTQRGSRKRKRIGRVLAVILQSAVLLSILAFAAWWSWSVCKAIDHRWKMQRPVVTISDVLMIPRGEKPLYIRGWTNDKTATIADSILTSIPGRNNPELGSQSSSRGFLRILPRLTNVQPGIIKPWFKGSPFGPLGYVREKGIVNCIKFGQPVLAIDARDAERWRKNSLETFRALLDGLPQGQAVVFVHPGPALKFRQDRESLRAVFPDIPCVCNVTFGSGANRTIGPLRNILRSKKKILPRTRVITSDMKFAKLFRGYFGKACKADIITSQPPTTNAKKKPKPNNWLNYFPDIRTLVKQQQKDM